jgi:hypothetical protein
MGEYEWRCQVVPNGGTAHEDELQLIHETINRERSEHCVSGAPRSYDIAARIFNVDPIGLIDATNACIRKSRQPNELAASRPLRDKVFELS